MAVLKWTDSKWFNLKSQTGMLHIMKDFESIHFDQITTDICLNLSEVKCRSCGDSSWNPPYKTKQTKKKSSCLLLSVSALVSHSVSPGHFYSTCSSAICPHSSVPSSYLPWQAPSSQTFVWKWVGVASVTQLRCIWGCKSRSGSLKLLVTWLQLRSELRPLPVRQVLLNKRQRDVTVRTICSPIFHCSDPCKSAQSNKYLYSKCLWKMDFSLLLCLFLVFAHWLCFVIHTLTNTGFKKWLKL